ncbi:MAG TPA: hypothetical protein VGW40_14165 [Allosphingosinicella sp.]|nr:hypothetical protein [Allosphingosinicella sp.]
MRISAFLLGALCASQAAAQRPEPPPVRYPDLPRAAADAAGFVPAGWAIVATRRGDLNGDGAADLVLLLQMRDRANVLAIPLGDRTERWDTNPHMLALAFAAPRGGFRLAASNRGLFLRPVVPWDGSEPLGEDTIRIERGTLLVHFGYLRGWAGYRFRWQGGAMRLIGYDDGGASGGCVSTISINYLTGRARWEKGLISSDRGRVVWRGLRRGDRPTLDRIDLETFRPEETIAGPPLLCPEPGR